MLGGNCRKVSMVNGDDGYGNALHDVIKSSLMGRSGVTIATDTKVPTTLASDYKSQSAEVVGAHPDCLVLIVYSDVGAAFLRDLNAAIKADSGHDWSKFYVSGSDGEYDTAFIPNGQSDPADPKSPNSTEGCYGTTPDPAPDTPDYKAFRNLWQQVNPGTEPDPYTANQYDAAIVLALAIHQAGTATDGTKIRDALYKVTDPKNTVFGPDKFIDAVNAISNGLAIKYRGASGPIDFDQYGNVTGDYIVWHVEKQMDGTFKFATVGKIKSSELTGP
jgi:ABC-type branched-subunit amino acid transport system substrate-binding protein